ncbi:MAG: BolA family protein [Pseudomonadota bacterium]
MSRKGRIEHLLTDALSPGYLEVVDESHQHNVPEGAESHFKVTVVSSLFEGMNRVGRHRVVNKAMADEFSGGLHALALHTYAPDEWAAMAESPDSPPCLGGGRA